MAIKKAKTTNLSPHFTIDELTASQTAIQRNIKNEPNKAELQDLKKEGVLTLVEIV